MATGWYWYSVGLARYWCGIYIDVASVWYDFGMALVWYWYGGFGIGLVGMVLLWHLWYWYSIVMVLVWYCYGIRMVLV